MCVGLAGVVAYEARTGLRGVVKGLFSEATKAAIRNVKERPVTIEMHVRLPIYDLDDT